MGTLTGKQIDNTYDGLIKTDDEQPINATPKRLQDGLGNDLPVKVGTAGMVYDGAQDFTSATVTGITGTDTTYTLGVDESTPDGVITLQASDGSPIQEVVLQANGNISMNTTVASNTLDVTVAPYEIATQQDGADAVEIQLNSTHGDSNITLDAGTNITLTQTGNNILIDAAGGGTDTTYDFGAAGAGGNINLALTGSDATNDVVSIQAGTNITLTDNGSNTFTIDATGGGGPSYEQIYKPERRFSDQASDNTWNFAMPQNGNNYSSGGFQTLIDVALNRRFFTEVWASSVTEVTVLIDAGQFNGSCVAEIWDSHPETGMPANRIATSASSFTTGTGTYRWLQMIFPATVNIDYQHYYISIKPDSGTNFGGLYGAVAAGANIGRMVTLDVAQSPPNPNDAVEYVGGIYDGQISTGTTYPLNYQWSTRIDMFPNVMMKE